MHCTPVSLSTNHDHSATRRVVAVCGPTAGGKSDLADSLAFGLSETCNSWVTTLSVDSMQVYKGLPVITNQDRRRPAEMIGFLPVKEDWNVARHRERSEEIISELNPELPFLLDAGTGMYLNALLLDIPLAPRVPDNVRENARSATVTRREARKKELEILGAPERGSIWRGSLRYETTLVYLRPPKETLDSNIRDRSARITSKGVDELQEIYGSGLQPNPSLRTSIGVQEITAHLSGEIDLERAQQAIESRTRKLARRQRRWFDKLVRSLPGKTGEATDRRAEPRVIVLERAEDLNQYFTHSMHDIL